MPPSISGLNVAREDYPAGQAGVDHTINKIVTYILEGRHNALARQFAEGIIQQAGYSPNAPLSHRQIAQAFLSYVRASVRYRPDAHMTETVVNPVITLCVPGAVACIPVGDCDDGTAILGWLNTAYGVPVRLLIQHFNSNTDHVLLEIQDDNGEWLACDFSNFNAENHPIGWKPAAASEYRIDPFDSENLKIAGARDVEFVAVGRVPRMLAGLPRVTLGRLPPRYVGGVGEFQQAAIDLGNQVDSVIQAGDTYLGANPPEFSAAVSAYQAATQAGASSIGPEIDAAGATAVTQPLTHQAWLSNGDIQAITAANATAATARQAQTIAKANLALYRQAITDGTALLNGKTSGSSSMSIGQLTGWAVGLGAVAGVAYVATRRVRGRKR